MLFLGDGKIEDKDLPHRTKLTQLILDEYAKEMVTIRGALATAVGRVSLTSDLWSDTNLTSHMAVTAHYISRDPITRRLRYEAGLVAFRAISGQHSGANIAEHLFAVIKDLGILHKVSLVETDSILNPHMSLFIARTHDPR
jgi:hypothetical protein